jgi:plastocyanin
VPQQRDTMSVFAALASVLALVFGIVALATSGDGETVVSGGSAENAAVELSEYAIAPAELSVDAGGTLEVTNNGAVGHDLTVEGADLTTGVIAPGEAASLDLGDLEPGTYTVLCSIPGHRQLGMEGTLTIGEGAGDGGTAAPAHGGPEPVEHTDWEKLDADMTASLAAFPAETEGLGGQVLDPVRTAPDGTKEFELTAEIVDWEVEPGKFVQAWTYNGVVPGPTFDLEVGDKVRVTIRNELPISTDVHWHGLDAPWEMDGVAPLTQPFVEPGQSFTYEFSPQRPMVGMYHAHNHGFQAIPNGLLGAVLVGDLPLPAGVQVTQELPMVLNDAGTIGFALNGKSWPATAPIVAKQGETVMIHYMNEGLGAHPMHLHGLDQLVIAKDGHPLAQPYLADTVNVAPGERYTVLVNASRPGTWVYHCHIVTHAERTDGLFGMVTAFVVQ